MGISVLIGASASAQMPATSAEIVVRALALIDTPYRYGGRSPAGFDCSGFVGYVFAESTGIELPRRSEDMIRVGDVLDRTDLAAGDLVFFNTLGRRYSHVGIYLGDGRFVHAPARGGRVRVERIGEPYWRARYNGARRVGGDAAIQAAAVTMPTAAAATFDGGTEARITP